MNEAAQPASRPRIVPTEGIHNLRDYGGYGSVDGGRLIRGVLFRSGELTNASDSDLNLVGALNLGAAFDLRGSNERLHAPCRWPSNFRNEAVSANGETAIQAPHIEAAAVAFDGASARRVLCERYATVPFRPVLVSIYSRYLTALSQSSEPTLVFCTAGKDRTGVIVALVQTLLGVHPDDVLSDYLLTNTAGDGEKRIAALRADLQRRFGASITEDGIRVLTSVEPAFLETAFAAIRRECGSLNTYFDSVLLISRNARERIRENFVA